MNPAARADERRNEAVAADTPPRWRAAAFRISASPARIALDRPGERDFLAIAEEDLVPDDAAQPAERLAQVLLRLFVGVPPACVGNRRDDYRG